MTAGLEERLAALEAADAIRELPARYAAAYARLDVDALVALYAPDVELASGARGHEALHAHFSAGIRGAGPGLGLAVVVLHTDDHVIDLDGADTAHGTVYCHGEVQRRDGSAYHQAIMYSDRYVRVEDRWLFAAQRRHELFYGTVAGTRPVDLPDAHWPRSQVGRGTLPFRWPSWQRFWAGEADRAELQQLVQRYAAAVDARDDAGLRALFTAGGVVVVPPERARDGVLEVPAGRIVASVLRYDATRHEVGNSDFLVAGNRATGRTSGEAHHFYRRDGQRRDSWLRLHYDDRYTRAPGGWRIAHRTLVVDASGDEPAM